MSMVTVSVVESNSPISLRTCGSSYNRKRLQCGTPEKQPSFIYRSRFGSLRDASMSPQLSGLEAALVSSPLISPEPRSLLSPYSPYSRCATNNTSIKSPDISTDEFSEEELDEGLWRESRDTPDNLIVVGSKPHLNQGMWTAMRNETDDKPRDTSMVVMDDGCDMDILVRETAGSPDNPPPSPVNFNPSLENFVVGGQKLSYPDRGNSTPGLNCRDFTPGYVKQPLYHCMKCEGKMIGTEQSQIALNRRMSQIMNNRVSQHRFHDNSLSRRISSSSNGCYHDYQDRIPIADTYDIHHGISPMSFCEIYAKEKRDKREREREMAREREIRREEMRYEEMTRLMEKIRSKDLRSKDVLMKIASRGKLGQTDRKNERRKARNTEARTQEARNNVKSSRQTVTVDKNASGKKLTDVSPPPKPAEKIKPTNQLPEVCSACKTEDQDAMSSLLAKETVDQYDNMAARRKHNPCSCHSDTWPCSCENELVNDKLQSDATDTDTASPDSTRCRLPSLSAVTSNQPSQTTLDTTEADSVNGSGCSLPSIENAASSKCEKRVVSPENKDKVEVHKTEVGTSSVAVSDQVSPAAGHVSPEAMDITMSATVIVPHRDMPCSQWVSFNGDNEPILNNAPEVDDGCDTFLKRLQRTKFCDSNDQAMPSGQQFCFEAMVDKRYNRWKRRRRKKNAEIRRSQVVHNSDSSDENEERNSVMERLIDNMYEQIHGPVPQTPNGSRDTPRMRNRRRRSEVIPESLVDSEVEPAPAHYDASSEWTSASDVARLSSSSGGHVGNNDDAIVKNRQDINISEPSTDDLCSWPYLEKYKQEIMKRLKNTPPDQLEDLDQSEWLPELCDNYEDDEENHMQDPSDHVLDDDIDETEMVFKPCDDGSAIRETESPRAKFHIGEASDIVCPESDHEQSTTPRNESAGQTTRLAGSPKQTTCLPGSSEQTPRLAESPDQNYSYNKWSRRQRETNKKPVNATGSKLQSRSSASSWTEMTLTRDRFHQSQDPLAATLKPLKLKDATTNCGTRKNYKEVYNTRKQNINLPALGKNVKGQTVPNRPRKNSLPQQDKPKSKVSTPEVKESRPRTHPTQDDKTSSGVSQESQPVPEFLFRDYYLRSLYGHRARLNNDHGEGKLRKTLTVDSLEIGSKKGRKKQEDSDKPSDLAFTRSFTFSMFDLPNIYKMYNNALEKKAYRREESD